MSFTKFIITTLHNKPNINHETYERVLPLACKKILILGHLPLRLSCELV